MVSEGSGNVIVTFVLEKDIAEAVDEVREKVAAAPCASCRRTPCRPSLRKAGSRFRPSCHDGASAATRSSRELTEIADKQIRRASRNRGRRGRGRHQRRAQAPDQHHARHQQDERLQPDRAGCGARRAHRKRRNAGRPHHPRRPRNSASAPWAAWRDVEQFNDIIIKNVNGAPVRIRDVGYAEDGMAERRNFAYYKGQPAVILEVQRQTGTNTVKVVDAVLAAAGPASTSNCPRAQAAA